MSAQPARLATSPASQLALSIYAPKPLIQPVAAPPAPAKAKSSRSKLPPLLRPRATGLCGLRTGAVLRPADARWQLALRAASGQEKVPPRFLDPIARQAKLFVGILTGRWKTNVLPVARRQQFQEAWQLRQLPVTQSPREAIELLVVAGASCDEIATETSIEQGVIELYEQLFFDVRSGLHVPGQILQQIRPEGVGKGRSEGRLALEKRRMALAGGIHVAKALIHMRFGDPSQSPTAVDVSAYLKRETLDALELKAALAAAMLDPANPRDARCLLRVDAALGRWRTLRSKVEREHQADMQAVREGVKVFLAGNWFTQPKEVPNTPNGSKSGAKQEVTHA